MTEPKPKYEYAGTVAIILAAGMALSLVVITTTILVAVLSEQFYVLGENTTQILIGWGGGIIGVLGAFIGYIVGRNGGPKEPPTDK